VCIERPANVDAAYISSNDIVYPTQCFSTGGREYCCANVPEGNLAAVYVIGQKTITQPLSLISSNILTKTFGEKWAVIFIQKEGNFLVIENIDKNYVERASYIESPGMIVLREDPIIGWHIHSTEKGYVIYYKVKKGKVPPTLPVVKLATCNLTIKRRNVDVFYSHGKRYIHLTLDVYLGKDKIIPPSIRVSINGREAPVSFEPDMSATVFSPVEGDKALLEVSVSTSLCRQHYKEEIPLTQPLPWQPIALFIALVFAVLLLKLRAR